MSSRVAFLNACEAYDTYFKGGEVMKIIIMRGIPGSGKTTMIEKEWPGAVVVSADFHFQTQEGYVFKPSELPLAHAQCLNSFASLCLAAEPRYVLLRGLKEGNRFFTRRSPSVDPTKLETGEVAYEVLGHAVSLCEALGVLPERERDCANCSLECKTRLTSNTVMVVDNTNTTVAEIAPYYALAEAYGHEVEIVTLSVDPEIAAARNVHDVSLKKCEVMVRRLLDEEKHFPAWWKHRVVNTDTEA